MSLFLPMGPVFAEGLPESKVRKVEGQPLRLPATWQEWRGWRIHVNDHQLGMVHGWVTKVSGTAYRLEALQEQVFAAGKPLRLIPEPDNPHDDQAVGVWDADRRLQVGYLPRPGSHEIFKALAEGEHRQVLCIREGWMGGKRRWLDVLVTEGPVDLREPRAGGPSDDSLAHLLRQSIEGTEADHEEP